MRSVSVMGSTSVPCGSLPVRDVATFEFGVTESGYYALKHILDLRRFDSMPGIPCRFFFSGSYAGAAQETETLALVSAWNRVTRRRISSSKAQELCWQTCSGLMAFPRSNRHQGSSDWTIIYGRSKAAPACQDLITTIRFA